MYQFGIFLHKLVHHNVPTYLYELLIKRSEIHPVNVRVDTYDIPLSHLTSKF